MTVANELTGMRELLAAITGNLDEQLARGGVAAPAEPEPEEVEEVEEEQPWHAC